MAEDYAEVGRQAHLRAPRIAVSALRRVILGIDPGIANCGWGMIQENGRTLSAVAWGCIETPAKTPSGERLWRIHQELLDVAHTWKPTSAAYEHPWLGGAHPPAALLLGRVVGVVELLWEEYDREMGESIMPLAAYSPTEVKQATTMRGLAQKWEVGRMVRVILGMETVPTPDHAADALAVAITHAMKT